MPQTPSVTDIKAGAETALVARQKAVDAKAAAAAAGDADDALNEASVKAEQDAAKAEADVLALSRSLPADVDPDKKKEKLLRKRGIIDKELKTLGVVPAAADDDEDDDDDEDLDKPVTRRDLQRIEAGKARTTATQMANELADPLDRAAVSKALGDIVPSTNPEVDFKKAVAIANIERNSKVLEEVGRRPVARTTPTGTGAPANREEAFVPTAEEAIYMKAGILNQKDIVEARKKYRQ